MTIQIDKKIVAYSIVSPAEDALQAALAPPPLPHLQEAIERPDILKGATYKVKTPLSDHALYITINDIVLNAGTAYESRRPFEVFINSKAMEHFQWIVALTRILSAIFRKGGDVTFLLEEMRSVFDPKGGYFKKGGKYMPSLVAEIGDVISLHMRATGILKDEGDTHHRQWLAEQRTAHGVNAHATDGGDFPKDSSLCGKCHVQAVVVTSSCTTCLNCGDSKCS